MIILMVLGGIASYFKAEKEFLMKSSEQLNVKSIRFLGLTSLYFFIGFYVILLLANYFTNFSEPNLVLMESFFRIGALIFGGGHVVIPMILTEFASKKMITENEVLTGFSIVSFLPGPMFNLSGYIGYLINGVLGGFLCAFCIFLPGILLTFVSIPFIDNLNKNINLQHFFAGLATTSVGFIFSSALRLFIDTTIVDQQIYFIFGFINVIICVSLLFYKNLSAPLIIIFGGLYGFLYEVVKSLLF